MKRLIICCDGTWNNADQEDNGVPAPTNVIKIFNAIVERDPQNNIEQLKYYHPGPGGEGGILEAVTGGTVGAGISHNICSAYYWLGNHYKDGDEVYLFGFSRGAFAARSLGAWLGHGLLRLNGLKPHEAWKRVHKAYNKGYRIREAKLEDWAEDWAFFNQRNALPIRFIGVWDTVGALGVPDDLEIFNYFDDKKKWQFHETNLGNHVKTARHAMAIDEIRSVFSITRWTNHPPHPGALEVWFPGVHADVGGGYANSDLADGALKWMIEESQQAGLVFRKDYNDLIKPNPLGVIHNSYKGVFAKLRSRPRNVDAMIPANQHLFHPSALIRQKVSPIGYPPYHPTRLLAVGESCSVDIYAEKHWNPTGVYMDMNQEFMFSAEGEWMDADDACDWHGTEDTHFTMGDIIRNIGTFLGKFEDTLKKVTKNQSTDFLGTKRVEKFKWFAMIGAISNDQGEQNAVTNDGSAVCHYYCQLDAFENEPLQVRKSGYFFCFANDVWSLYGNNHGSIQLTIRRVK